MLSTRAKIALATCVQTPIVAARRLLKKPPTLNARRSGISWALDLREGIDFSIWLLGAFEKRTVAAYSHLLGPGAVVIDVGANVGAHTLPLARIVGPTGKVHAFEPVSWALSKLRANLRLNPDLAGCIEPYQLMLAERLQAIVPDAIYASWPLGSDGQLHDLLRARALSTAGATSTTLDAFIEAKGLDRLDLMKIDVDGYECRVVQGARGTLRRFRPYLIIELSPHSLAEQGDSLELLLDLLQQLDYELYDLWRGQKLPADRSELVRDIPERGGINALARPRQST